MENIERLKRKLEIQCELQGIDLKSIRAIRANETARVAALEEQAVKLRTELKQLEA